jgi:ABC-type multidrug transport system fused ATPase/permease subunit
MQLKVFNLFFSFLNTIRSYGLLLDKNDKKKAFYMLFLVIIGTFLEMLSMSIIFPVIQLVLNENFINEYSFLKKNFHLTQNLLIIYTLILLIIIFFIKNIFLTFIIIYKAKFIELLRNKLSKKLHLMYLGKDYSFFINTHTSELIRNLHQEVPKIIKGMDGILVLITEILVLIGISVILFYVSPVSTSIIIVFILIILLIYGFVTKKKVHDMGKKDQILFSMLLKETQQGYGNFKEILIYQLKDIFMYQYKNILIDYCRNNRTLSIYQQFPRILFEQIGISLIIGVSIFIFFQEPDKAKAIGIISLYAYAFFRLLPSITKLIVNTQLIVFVKPSVDIINVEFESEKEKDLKIINNEAIDFKEQITLENVSFNIGNNNKILEDISLNIKKNSKIGIIGQTGSGKSTLLNLLMGLIEPTSGKIKIDKKTLKDSPIWKKKISFVSQSAYLLDESIIKNITFNQNDNLINKKRLYEAIKIANLTEFVEKSEFKLQTIVGERGAKISGGELQRICIARAIYKDSEVLILDEFTSALDEKTENKIIENIFHLEKTIIIASHRVQALKYCDEIYEVIDKRLKKNNNKS